ncbi:hypothetical protein T265_10850 [Opisthorchis viverrini]|uniref:Uncharacterized protein n=1 Tax=Opisthorchis viverrini TaxID=6198 RepID=A0A074ZZV0_OPIVI|nr:hypothetical protein T265_10850 [Opisthorchis viverrini]KER20659.1 hypothetical protein T265_10850 [Opisthorchis viverrini]
MQWFGVSKYKTGAERRLKLLPKIPECECTTDDEGVVDGRSAENSDFANWRNSLLVCIADGARQAERQPEDQAHGVIAEGTLSGTLNVVQTRARLTRVVERMFPDVWTLQNGAVREGVPKSQKEQRGANYA